MRICTTHCVVQWTKTIIRMYEEQQQRELNPRTQVLSTGQLTDTQKYIEAEYL